MNERIKEIEDRAQELAWEEWKQLPESNNGDKMDIHHLTRFKRKFAELIVGECIDQCSQEWYDLNNSSKEELDDRGIAIRVGQKNGVLKVQHRLKKHFGVEE